MVTAWLSLTCPGWARAGDRDAEYEALYREDLLELDLVLWLIKADDRALSVDEYFWRHNPAPGTSAGAVCGDAGRQNGALP